MKFEDLEREVNRLVTTVSTELPKEFSERYGNEAPEQRLTDYQNFYGTKVWEEIPEGDRRYMSIRYMAWDAFLLPELIQTIVDIPSLMYEAPEEPDLGYIQTEDWIRGTLEHYLLKRFEPSIYGPLGS